MEERIVGPHRLVREGPKLFTIHFASSPEVVDMVEVLDAMAAMMGADRFVLMLDFTKVDTLSAGVRRVVGEKTRELDIAGFAMFGANFHMKVIAKLVNSAIALFRKESIPQEFFGDHEAARKWAEAVSNDEVRSAV